MTPLLWVDPVCPSKWIAKVQSIGPMTRLMGSGVTVRRGVIFTGSQCLEVHRLLCQEGYRTSVVGRGWM